MRAYEHTGKIVMRLVVVPGLLLDCCFRCVQIESNIHPMGITERIIYGIT